MTFKEQIAADLAAVFFNTSEFAESVTITRATAVTADVAAIRNERLYQVEDSDGVMVGMQIVDWDIIATDYEISSAAVSPRTGDRITDENDVVYEVMPLPGLKEYESAGESGDVLRVHTKRIK